MPESPELEPWEIEEDRLHADDREVRVLTEDLSPIIRSELGLNLADRDAVKHSVVKLSEATGVSQRTIRRVIHNSTFSTELRAADALLVAVGRRLGEVRVVRAPNRPGPPDIEGPFL